MVPGSSFNAFVDQFKDLFQKGNMVEDTNTVAFFTGKIDKAHRQLLFYYDKATTNTDLNGIINLITEKAAQVRSFEVNASSDEDGKKSHTESGGARIRRVESNSHSTPKLSEGRGCFTCSGPHMQRNCPIDKATTKCDKCGKTGSHMTKACLLTHKEVEKANGKMKQMAITKGNALSQSRIHKKTEPTKDSTKDYRTSSRRRERSPASKSRHEREEKAAEGKGARVNRVSALQDNEMEVDERSTNDDRSLLNSEVRTAQSENESVQPKAGERTARTYEPWEKPFDGKKPPMERVMFKDKGYKYCTRSNDVLTYKQMDKMGTFDNLTMKELEELSEDEYEVMLQVEEYRENNAKSIKGIIDKKREEDFRMREQEKKHRERRAKGLGPCDEPGQSWSKPFPEDDNRMCMLKTVNCNIKTVVTNPSNGRKRELEYVDPISIPLLINSTRVYALYDTGADISIISKGLAERLNLRMGESNQKFTQAVKGPRQLGIGCALDVHIVCGEREILADIEVLDIHDDYEFILGRELNKIFGFCLSNIPSSFSDDPEYLETEDIQANKLFSSYSPFFNLDRRDSKLSKRIVKKVQTQIDDNLLTEDTFCLMSESIVSLDMEEHHEKKGVFINQYKISTEDCEIVTAQVNKWYEDGITILSEVGSKWNSSLVVVPKKDLQGNLTGKRICLDCRPVNTRISEDKHPLPNVKDIFQQVAGHKIFSKLDLKESYHQFLLKKTDRVKTSFYWNGIQYMFKGAPFGLKTLTSVFQRVMSRILMGLPFVVVYVDDILVYSNSEEEHIEHLKMVLERLTEASLTIRLSKCQFGYGSVEILGHILSPEGMRATEEKIKNVIGFPKPKRGKDIQSFLGVTGYLRDYVPLYAAVSYPLERIKNLGLNSVNAFQKNL